MQHWVVGYFANKLTVPEEYCENFIMSGLFYYVLRMYSKMILAFSDVSVCMSNFCKTLENGMESILKGKCQIKQLIKTVVYLKMTSRWRWMFKIRKEPPWCSVHQANHSSHYAEASQLQTSEHSGALHLYGLLGLHGRRVSWSLRQQEVKGQPTRKLGNNRPVLWRAQWEPRARLCPYPFITLIGRTAQ